MPTTTELLWPQICNEGHYHSGNAVLPPLTVTGMKLWLVDKGVAQGPTTTWLDYSGLGNHVTGVGTPKPVNNSGNVSNLSAYSFNGVDNAFHSSSPPLSFAITQPFTITLVVQNNKPVGATAGTIWTTGNSANNVQNLNLNFQNSGIAQFGWRNDANTVVTTVGTTNLGSGSPHILTVTWDTTTQTLFVDGVSEGTPGTPTGASTFNQMSFGSKWTNAESGWLGGAIGEVLLYDTALSTANRRVVENYLGRKWSVRLT